MHIGRMPGRIKTMQELKKIEVLEHPFAPTPIVRLSGDYSDNEIWIKREDLLPFSFGGERRPASTGK